jgi:O-antigen/teichoic acid export membrane protein
MFKSRSSIVYLFANYAAVFLNMLSGILLARKLSTDTRGLVAIISLCMTIMIFITSGNSSNSAMMSGNSTIRDDSRIELRHIYKHLTLFSFVLFLVCSPFFFMFIYDKSDLKLSFLFIIAAIPFIFNSLIFYAEGIMKRNGSVFQLSLNRFIGLAIPSIYIFILNFLGLLQINYLVFSHTLVTVVLLYSNKRYLRSIEKDYVQKFYYFVSTSVRNSGFYVFEFIAGYSLIIVASICLDLTSLAYLAIALSFSSLMDAFIPTIESKFYSYFANADFKNRIFRSKLYKKLIAIVSFDLLFIPATLIIPILLGEKYEISSKLALILVFTKIPTHITRYLSTILLSLKINAIPFMAQAFLIGIFYLGIYLFASRLDIYVLLNIYLFSQIITLCFIVFLIKVKLKF